MSKRVEQMTGLEAIDTLVDALEILSMLEFGEESDDDDMKACAEAYGNGVMSVPIALDESQWVKLPKDADGVTIHAGDVLDGYGKTIEVVEMRYGRSGWVLISRDGSGYADTFAFTHHHAPTVEDVLIKMLEKAVGYSDAHTTVALNAIAEFSAKLQLREDK